MTKLPTSNVQSLIHTLQADNQALRDAIKNAVDKIPRCGEIVRGWPSMDRCDRIATRRIRESRDPDDSFYRCKRHARNVSPDYVLDAVEEAARMAGLLGDDE